MAVDRESLQSAEDGYGPILQRDYWASIKNCRMSPSELIAFAATNLSKFVPATTVEFRPQQTKPQGPSLSVDDGFDIHIKPGVECEVKVVHTNANSFTLATLPGHPEAGRITFGSYRGENGQVIFHIRSIARSSKMSTYTGFLLLGESLQTETWTELINSVAVNAGDGVEAAVASRSQTLELSDEELKKSAMLPTYLAQGD